MGNEVISANDSSFRLCSFNTQEDPFRSYKNPAAVNHSQRQNFYSNNDCQIFDVQNVNRTVLKQFSENSESNDPISKQPKSQINQQNKFESKVLAHSKTKIKRISSESQHRFKINQQISKQEHLFNQRIEKALKVFKNLNILHIFKSSFNTNFPILILNKNKEVSTLRKQIHLEKEKHPYFQDENLVKIENEDKDQKELKFVEEKYYLFQVLQKIERVVTRIFQTGRHEQCLKEIIYLDNQVRSQLVHSSVRKLERFIDKLNEINFEFLDMLYFQLSILQRGEINKNMVDSSKNQENRKHGFSVVDVKQLIMRQKEDSLKESYQNLKQVGLQMYAQNKACFYILAGDNQELLFQNINDNSSDQTQTEPYLRQTHEFYSLNLPTNPVLLEVLLDRYNAFAELLEVSELTVMILANESKMQQINSLAIKHLRTWSRINLIVLKQSEMPCLSVEGDLILTENSESEKEIMKYSTGTGDLWDLLREPHNQQGLKYLIDNKFQFIEVIGTSNCLDQCFDCFMLGYIKQNQLQWGTKVVQPNNQLAQLVLKKNQNRTTQHSQKNNQKTPLTKHQFQQSTLGLSSLPPINSHTFQHDTLLYREEDGSLQTINENEQNYREKIKRILLDERQHWTFTNHSIFNVDFIKKKILHPSWKQSVSYSKKPITNYSTNSKIITFQKNLTDIFKPYTENKTSLNHLDQSEENEKTKSSSQDHQKFILFKYERDTNFYPLLFKENSGIFDVQGASRAISKKFLQFLEISIEKNLGCSEEKMTKNFLKCYIDPHVSLEGEELEQIKLEIERRLNKVLACDTNLNKSSFNFQIREMESNISHSKIFQGSDYQIQSSIEQATTKTLSSVSQILIQRQIVQNILEKNKVEIDFDNFLSERINIQIN